MPGGPILSTGAHAEPEKWHAGDRFWRILLKKSKIERLRKFRESRCLDISAAAMLARADTQVRGRFCGHRFGPSYRSEQTASAALKNFVRQPQKTFSTVSAQSRYFDEA
jgi:hypothetical protein